MGGSNAGQALGTVSVAIACCLQVPGYLHQSFVEDHCKVAAASGPFLALQAVAESSDFRLSGDCYDYRTTKALPKFPSRPLIVRVPFFLLFVLIREPKKKKGKRVLLV